MDKSSAAAWSSSVQLRECVEELLKFILMSSIEGKLPLPLSDAYCGNLLRDDHTNPLPTNDDPFLGIPFYPLYKRLASSLYQSMYSGALCMKKEFMPVIENMSVARKQEGWSKLMVDEGYSLLNMLKEVKFELQVSEPFFSQFNDGMKTIETGCAVDYNPRIKPGDFILLNSCMMLQVQDVHHYDSIPDMLEAGNFVEVIPMVNSTEEGASRLVL